MLLVLFILSSIIFAIEIHSHIKVIRQGKPSGRNDHKKNRILYMLKSAFLQQRIRERWWGKLHIVMFYTFLLFLISAIELMIQSVWSGFSLTNMLGTTVSGVIYIIQTYFAWMCLSAVIILMIRRFVKRNTLRSTFDAWLILGLILIIMLSHFGVISSLIASRQISDAFSSILPVMTLIGSKFTDPDVIHTISAWIHIFCICIFLIWIPRGKHLHIVMAFPALYSQYRLYVHDTPVTGLDHADMDSYEKSLESAIEKDLPESEWPVVGIENYSHLSRRQLLEAFACTQCQRCTDVCPMVSAGLDGVQGPMQSMLNLRDLCRKRQNHTNLVPDLTPDAEIWSCTQCGACDRSCSIGTEHTNRIVQIRQAMVCRDQKPAPLNKVFTAFERSGNPWGYPKSQRLSVTIPANIKHTSSGHVINLQLHGVSKEIHTILFFVGCMGRYDQSFNKTVQHSMDLLCKLGLEVKLLENEYCCGEPVRKLGNESAYAQQMKRNLEQIQKTPHDLILTACPHCAQVLGNDYVTSDYTPEVMHVWEFLAQIRNRMKSDFISAPKDRSYVLHMPCMLGKRPESPAGMLKLASHLQIKVIDQDVGRSHCCGAGGGQFFVDTLRTLTRQRVDELIKTTPDCIVTSCPFCQQMLQDECSRQNPEHPTRVVQILDMLDV